MDKRLPRKRIWLFRVITLLIPFVLLLTLEMLLRLFHYGYDTSLFIEYPGNKEYWVMNPDASRKYFTDQSNATTGNREPFRKEKEAGAFRVFVLGESTTIGYPYFHNGSFHRWLLYRLMRSFPDKKIEMVNVSLTAVNSYTVLGFSKEVVNYQPDAVLIYTGHNEYYGALGVGSTNRLGGSPRLVTILLGLRELKIVQLMTRVIGGVGRIFSSGSSKSGKTRMELMVADQQIGYGSVSFARGIDQFRENMDKTLAVFERAHVPVFLSNLVSNEKDLRPFVSLPADSLLPAAFRALYAQGKQALGAGDSVAARRAFTAADRVDSSYAQCRYYLGGLAYAMGDFAVSASYYRSARELDALRFRAPDSINGVIADLGRKYGNVHLVDTRSAFTAASGHGVIGDDLILEHVHPNLMGYALLSDVFYTSLRVLLPKAGAREMSFPELLREMPVTVMDSLDGVYRIENLRHYWPFNESAEGHGDIVAPSRAVLHVRTREEELAYSVTFEHLPWEEAMSGLYEDYSRKGEWKKARTVMEALVLEHPDESEYLERTAMLCGKSQEYEKAIFYFGQAFRRGPSFERARYLFVLCLQQDRPGDAMPYLDYAIGHNTQGLDLRPVRAATLEVMRLQRELVLDPANGRIIDSIAQTYRRMGNKEGAMKYANNANRALLPR